MQLSFLELSDLVLRFLIIGQLSALCIVLLSKKINNKSVLSVFLCLCLTSYLLLTAPIPDHQYGMMRGVFLLLVEIAPYVLWCLVYILFNGDLKLQNWSVWLKAIVGAVLLWFLYFFGYLQGVGAFHQVNHAIEFLLVLHIIYLTTKEFPDDLVDARRQARVFVVIYTSFYFLVLVSFELGDASIRGMTLFGLTNTLAILLSTSVFSYFFFNDKFKDEMTDTLSDTLSDTLAAENTPLNAIAIPLVFQASHQQLCQVMQENFYTETQLSIKALAVKISTPEHQLRELINKHMGFRNFSEFLNSYRLPAACKQLEDLTQMRKPILTIALELGYGSIATFNRAFKGKMGMSPKEYRDQFQK